MTTLTIGCLQECQGCHRHKQEPGAPYCPDCTLVLEVKKDRRTWFVLEDFYHDQLWSDVKKVPLQLAAHPAYKKFESGKEFAEAYGRWRRWHR